MAFTSEAQKTGSTTTTSSKCNTKETMAFTLQVLKTGSTTTKGSKCMADHNLALVSTAAGTLTVRAAVALPATAPSRSRGPPPSAGASAVSAPEMLVLFQPQPIQEFAQQMPHQRHAKDAYIVPPVSPSFELCAVQEVPAAPHQRERKPA
eukprot:CAMPEP_0183465608 /NCGR_PEP_ID=MMETSP0370-20130417/147528_1 /TAXON_ID=268820 /ORGANISM="Peridinium aciculiferum, Strain PAER-2" /LENGTH=149 /DNA_ID=CAMNT_0025657829 /DNA_START=41 /DNA_END=489 /DNA_ORIENTATION=-